MRIHIAAALLGCAAASTTTNCLAGELHLLGNVPYAYAESASADGRVVAGQDSFSYWYWTFDAWVQPVPGSVPAGNGVGGQAGITDDGTVMTCSMQWDFNGVLKTEATLFNITTYEAQSVGSFDGANCDAERTGAWGLSADGSTVVGLGWQTGCQARAFRWRAATGVVDLGTLYFFKPTRANACNANGNVIVGWNDDYSGYRQAAVWNNGVQQNLTAPGNVKLREAIAVSGDGVWVGGIGRASLNNGAPWRWSQATGYQSLGPTPIDGTHSVTAFNHDGSKALCYLGFAAAFGEGYIWIQDRGYVPLEQYAQEHGVTIPADVHLALPLGISADEMTIVGTARLPNGLDTSPFVLDLHPGGGSCPADLDNSGDVGGADIGMLLGNWGGFGQGDLNGDGVVDGADIGILLGAWGPCL
ncbi:MAG: hypothetical protein U0625_11590 [Phycisphaerales bacterium]